MHLAPCPNFPGHLSTPGGPGATALLNAGARAVIAKGSGQLPLDLIDGVGEALVTTLTRVTSP